MMTPMEIAAEVKILKQNPEALKWTVLGRILEMLSQLVESRDDGDRALRRACWELGASEEES